MAECQVCWAQRLATLTLKLEAVTCRFARYRIRALGGRLGNAFLIKNWFLPLWDLLDQIEKGLRIHAHFTHINAKE
jgi:hypothetical protein